MDMNYNRLRIVVKSYLFRKRMAEKLDELEDTIKDYFNENEINSVCVAGYRISCIDGELDFKEAPPVHEDQLELFEYND